MIDRRVGHLREPLLDIAVEQPRLVGQHRRRRVVAHGEDRFVALRRHRPQHVGELFLGIAEGGLAGDEVGRPGVLPRPTDAHRLRLVVQPGAIGPARGQ